MTRIRLSRAELLHGSQKALEGIGVPHGLDRDAALNIVWLQAHGFDGIGLLATILSDPDTAWHPPELRDDGGRLRMVCPTAHGVWLAPPAVDLATEGRMVAVDRCLAAALFVGEAARRSAGGGTYSVLLDGQSGTVHALCSDGEAILCGELDHRPAVVTLQRRSDDSIAGRRSADDAAATQPGFLVDAALWNRIAAAAMRVLVPSNERSRSGAGAEVDDSA